MSTRQNEKNGLECLVCSHDRLDLVGNTFCQLQSTLQTDIRPRRIWRCRQCGCLRVDPLPEPAQLHEYYDSYSSVSHHRGSLAKWRRRRVLPYILDIASRLGEAKVLDIGCADGGLLKLLPAALEKFGLDVSAEACELARQHGFVTINEPFETADLKTKFDLIIVLDLLEHVDEPLKVLVRIAETLRPGGYVIIETGDAHSLAARFLGENWSYTATFGHLCVWTAPKLDEVARQVGFSRMTLSCGWHHLPGLLRSCYRVMLALGFHVFRKSYGALLPLSGRFSVLERLARHSPPGAPLPDHMIYIGQRKE